MSLKLYLIRHGQSEQNTKPDLMGQEAGEPLSPLGEHQAECLGQYLASERIIFDEAYTSHYKRAYDTCMIVRAKRSHDNPFLPLVFPQLREYSAGDMKGAKRTEILTFDVVAKMQELGMSFKFPNGESLFEVQQRAVTWLYDTVLSVRSDKERNVALFTHGMTIKCLLQHFLQFNQHMAWRISIDNTSMSILEFKNNMWFLKCINATPHLA